MIKKRTETKRLKCLIIYLGVGNHYRTSSQFSEVFLSNILFQSVVHIVREVTGQAVVVISHPMIDKFTCRKFCRYLTIN